MTLQPTILIDTREQNPWTFRDLPSERATLDTGDYTIKTLEHLIAVERKSLDDLVACVGYGRDRFKRELQRLRAYRYRCIIVEADLAQIQAGGWRSKVHPNAVMGSLAAWAAQYELPVVFGGDHESAAEYAGSFLFQAARCVALEHEAVRAMLVPESEEVPA